MARKKSTQRSRSKKSRQAGAGKGRQASSRSTKAKAKPRAKSAKAQAFDKAVSEAKPKAKKSGAGPKAFRDPRLPPIGTILESTPIQGKVVKIEVCDGYFKPRSNRPDGQAFSKSRYRSPSQVLHEIFGYWSNGWSRFGLGTFKAGKLVGVREG
jgi:hypothetical protein